MNVFARIINLDSRKDRWDLMQAYVKASRFDLKRFSAVQLTSQDDAFRVLSLRAKADIRRERVQHEALSGLGAVGCALSHFAVWSDFVASGADVCIVLEDDLDSKYASQFDAAVDSMLARKNWDIGLLGWCSTLPSRRRPDGSLVVFPTSAGFSGAQAYMLTQHAARTLMQHLFPLEMQVDYAMQAIAETHGLRIVASTVQKIRQTYTGSDVFRVCVLCEPSLVYAAFVVLVVIIVGLILRVRR